MLNFTEFLLPLALCAITLAIVCCMLSAAKAEAGHLAAWQLAGDLMSQLQRGLGKARLRTGRRLERAPLCGTKQQLGAVVGRCAFGWQPSRSAWLPIVSTREPRAGGEGDQAA